MRGRSRTRPACQLKTASCSQADEESAKSRATSRCSREHQVAPTAAGAPTSSRRSIGIVTRSTSHIAAVVSLGASLMEIVPLEDTLLVEGRILPHDHRLHSPEAGRRV